MFTTPGRGLLKVDEGVLFHLPGSTHFLPPEQLSRSERRKRLIDSRIAKGIHPLGYLPLHPHAAIERGGDGLTCGTCRYRVSRSYGGKPYPKCNFPGFSARDPYPRDTRSESSDIRAWWPACKDYKPEGEL